MSPRESHASLAYLFVPLSIPPIHSPPSTSPNFPRSPLFLSLQSSTSSNSLRPNCFVGLQMVGWCPWRSDLFEDQGTYTWYTIDSFFLRTFCSTYLELFPLVSYLRFIIELFVTLQYARFVALPFFVSLGDSSRQPLQIEIDAFLMFTWHICS